MIKIMYCLSNKFNNNKDMNMEIKSKEVIDRDTIWLVYYDKENDELYRTRVEKVKERWNKEEEYALDKYNDNSIFSHKCINYICNNILSI